MTIFYKCSEVKLFTCFHAIEMTQIMAHSLILGKSCSTNVWLVIDNSNTFLLSFIHSKKLYMDKLYILNVGLKM